MVPVSGRNVPEPRRSSYAIAPARWTNGIMAEAVCCFRVWLIPFTAAKQASLSPRAFLTAQFSKRYRFCPIPAFEHQSPENNLFSGLWPYNRQYAFIIQKGNSPRYFIRSIKIHPSDNSISLSLFLAECILPVSLNPILRYSRPAFTLFSSIQSVGVSIHFVMANCSNSVPYPLFCFCGRT